MLHQNDGAVVAWYFTTRFSKSPISYLNSSKGFHQQLLVYHILIIHLD